MGKTLDVVCRQSTIDLVRCEMITQDELEMFIDGLIEPVYEVDNERKDDL